MTKPFSIAFIRQRYAHDGGAERFVARMTEALGGQDLRITLIAREWAGQAGQEVVTLNPFYIGRLWRDWSFARDVCRELENRSFDLVQSHERLSCCDIYRAGDGVHREWLAQLARARGPLGRLGIMLNPYHHYVKRAEKRMFTGSRLKAVICNSRMVRDEIQHHFGLPDEKLHVIYSGVDIETFHPRLRQQYRAGIRTRYGIPQDAPLFLFVGSGFERKGVAALLRAMALLPKHGHLLVVGRDSKTKRYQHKADRLGIAGRVLFVGSQADVKPYYGAADALVLPTLYDPFPNVALEAMASGLPVITSNKSGAAELVESGKTGFIADAMDCESLASAMRNFYTTGTSATMGHTARELAARFSLKHMTRQMLDFYSTLMRVT